MFDSWDWSTWDTELYLQRKEKKRKDKNPTTYFLMTGFLTAGSALSSSRGIPLQLLQRLCDESDSVGPDRGGDVFMLWCLSLHHPVQSFNHLLFYTFPHLYFNCSYLYLNWWSSWTLQKHGCWFEDHLWLCVPATFNMNLLATSGSESEY